MEIIVTVIVSIVTFIAGIIGTLLIKPKPVAPVIVVPEVDPAKKAEIVNELKKQDPSVIVNNLDNADDIHRIESESDAEFDRIKRDGEARAKSGGYTRSDSGAGDSSNT